MAMTATATRATMGSLVNKLRMQSPHIVFKGSLSPAIHLCVKPFSGFEEYMANLLQQMAAVRLYVECERTIIFFSSLEILETTFSRFRQLLGAHAHINEVKGFRGSRVVMFHRCTAPEIKEYVLEEMRNPLSHLRMVFASSAFGLGIDAKGVTRVVHHSVPKEVNEFVQEIGRGGRGGGEVETVLFDRAIKISRDMAAYIATGDCRRAFLCACMGIQYQKQQRCCDLCDSRKKLEKQ